MVLGKAWAALLSIHTSRLDNHQDIVCRFLRACHRCKVWDTFNREIKWISKLMGHTLRILTEPISLLPTILNIFTTRMDWEIHKEDFSSRLCKVFERALSFLRQRVKGLELIYLFLQT